MYVLFPIILFLLHTGVQHHEVFGLDSKLEKVQNVSFCDGTANCIKVYNEMSKVSPYVAFSRSKPNHNYEPIIYYAVLVLIAFILETILNVKVIQISLSTTISIIMVDVFRPSNSLLTIHLTLILIQVIKLVKSLCKGR